MTSPDGRTSFQALQQVRFLSRNHQDYGNGTPIKNLNRLERQIIVAFVGSIGGGGLWAPYTTLPIPCVHDSGIVLIAGETR